MLNRKRTATVATRSSTKESRTPNIRTTPPHTRSLVLTFLAAISAAASLTTASRLALVAAAAVFTALAAGCTSAEQEDGQPVSATAEVEQQQQEDQPAAAQQSEDRLEDIDLDNQAKDALREIRDLAKIALKDLKDLRDRAEDDPDINNRDPIFEPLNEWIEDAEDVIAFTDDPSGCLDAVYVLRYLLFPERNWWDIRIDAYPLYFKSTDAAVISVWREAYKIIGQAKSYEQSGRLGGSQSCREDLDAESERIDRWRETNDQGRERIVQERYDEALSLLEDCGHSPSDNIAPQVETYLYEILPEAKGLSPIIFDEPIKFSTVVVNSGYEFARSNNVNYGGDIEGRVGWYVNNKLYKKDAWILVSQRVRFPVELPREAAIYGGAGGERWAFEYIVDPDTCNVAAVWALGNYS